MLCNSLSWLSVSIKSPQSSLSSFCVKNGDAIIANIIASPLALTPAALRLVSLALAMGHFAPDHVRAAAAASVLTLYFGLCFSQHSGLPSVLVVRSIIDDVGARRNRLTVMAGLEVHAFCGRVLVVESGRKEER